jgi:hypothetical protein
MKSSIKTKHRKGIKLKFHKTMSAGSEALSLENKNVSKIQSTKLQKLHVYELSWDTPYWTKIQMKTSGKNYLFFRGNTIDHKKIKIISNKQTPNI